MESLSTFARVRAGAAASHTAAFFRPPGTSDELWNRLTLTLLLIAAALVLLTFRSYGVTWDEDMQRWYGDMCLDQYLSWIGLAKPPHWLQLFSYGDLYNYGAVFDMAASALNRFSPLGVFETRHLLNAIIGLVGIVGAWKLGRRLGGARVGFFAALFLLLTPNYYGQMFNNPKDIPFAVGFVWATYYLVRIVPFLPRPPLRLVVKLGIAAGLAMAVRVGGLLIVCYLGLMLAVFATWQGFAARRVGVLITIGWISLWRVYLPVAMLAYGLMLIFWPWAQSAPLTHPLSALAVFSHEVIPTKILFDGHLYTPGEVPWAYLPSYIALALPELILLLLLAAPILAAAALARRDNWRIGRVLPLFMLGFTIVYPVVYAIAEHVVLFNGMRHFIFVLPAIAVATALVADIALGRLAEFPYRKPVYAALGLYGLAHVSVMVMLHPDQYVYYNGFIGGVAGAEGKFKLDYWANSYAEAVRGLENYLRQQYGANFEEREFTVAINGPPVSARYYFPPNFRQVVQAKNAEFVIGFSLDEAEHDLSDLPVFRVTRMGALLSVVVDHREYLAEERIARQPIARAMSRRAPDIPY